MSYTVGGAFDQFRSRSVDLDPEITRTARSSRDHLFTQMGRLDASDPDFPDLCGYYHSFGSFARRTKIRPLDDIDVLVPVNGWGTSAANMTGSTYTYALALTDRSAALARFADANGYVNSTRLLNQVKKSLASVPHYRRADIHKTLQAVTLNLVSYDWVFDVVPAVPIGGTGANPTYYLIPDGRANWIATDPRIDATNITDLNQSRNGQFLPLIRLLKYWNGRTHKPVLPSYYFENLARNVFLGISTIANSPSGLQQFFSWAPQHLICSCPDPKRLGPYLDAGIDMATKQKVSAAMQEAAKYTSYALTYEGQSNHKDAITCWGYVFGSEFPSYG